MSKGVESVSVTAFPAAAVMDELSEVQLAMVLLLVALVLLLVALIAANEERWPLSTGASMISTRIKRGQM
jgi:hypothetical protein